MKDLLLCILSLFFLAKVIIDRVIIMYVFSNVKYVWIVDGC